MAGVRLTRTLLGIALLVFLCQRPSQAQDLLPADVFAGLSLSQQDELSRYQQAQARHDARLDAYWREVEEKRSTRRGRRKAGQETTARDYVTNFPPRYEGPRLSRQLTDLIAKYEARRPPSPEKDIPGLGDFLSNAREHYGFVPERIADSEFKRRYAAESLALGFDKDQIVRVYALETGGTGAYDMQAKNRQGKEISTALGYAQLLSANSVNELVKYGGTFAARLDTMSRAAGTSRGRAEVLRHKAAVVRAMWRDVRRVRNEWSEHQRYANTPKGMAVHALNLDGDIGPWLQVYKLVGIKELAEKEGRKQLTGGELELMNLAGPATGLEMMEPQAQNVPTTNFFARRGYDRNSIVRDKTARELQRALDDRMDDNVKNPGAREFAAIFDRLGSGERGRVSRVQPTESRQEPRSAIRPAPKPRPADNSPKPKRSAERTRPSPAPAKATEFRFPLGVTQ